MIRLTWRQFRAQAYVAVGALVLVAVVVVVTGPRLFHIYDTSVVKACQAAGALAPGSPCATAGYALTSTSVVHALSYGQLREALSGLLRAVPALIGIFWGAPLVAHELETGTWRLAWTQSVSRRRWLAVKLAIPGLAGMAAAGLFSLMASVWSVPLNHIGAGRLVPGNFESQGIVPIGYAALAFAAGVAAGLLLRRTLLAMGTGLAAFAGVQLAMIHWVRPYLIPSLHLSAKLTGDNVMLYPTSSGGVSLVAKPPILPRLSGAWLYSTRAVDTAGHAPTSQFMRICGNANTILGGGPSSRPGARPHGGGRHPHSGVPGQGCIPKLAAKFHELVTYQPAGRYWEFQAYETAIFIVLGLAVAGFCFWWLRRRT